jgi:hypothetical protein
MDGRCRRRQRSTSLVANGNRARGIATTARRMRLLFESMLTEKIALLTNLRAAQLLDALTARPSRQGEALSVDTRKNTQAEAKTFGLATSKVITVSFSQ